MAAVVGLLSAVPNAYAEPSNPLSSEALMHDVRVYAALAPDHLTGTTDSATTERWLSEQLAAAGLKTGSDAYRFLRFIPRRVSLSVEGAPVESVAARFYSGTTPPQGIDAPLAWAQTGSASEFSQAEVKGKIAVVEALTLDTATEPTLDGAVSAAKAAGAAALVAVTEGPEDYPVQEDIDARAGELGMPVLFVGKRSGANVIAAAKNAASANVTLTAVTGWGCDSNVYAVLPGEESSRYIVIGTPTSGFDAAASERGAGVAAFLGLARYYASLPLSSRPATLVFAATTGHEDGFLGLPTLMKAHPEWFAHAEAYVHLGASIAAQLITEAPTGTVVRSPLDDPTRLMYTSENPILQTIAQGAFAGTGIASASPGVRNVGEQVYAYDAGIPVVSVSGGSFYFHTQGDQAEGVDPTAEEQVAQAFRSSIDQIAQLPPGTAVAANGLADELGAHQTPTSPGGGTPKPEDEPQPVARCKAPRIRKAAGNGPSVDERPQGVGGAGSLIPTYDEPQPTYPWEGQFKWRTFTTPSRATGAKLFGTIFAPLSFKKGQPDSRFGVRRPAVVIGPGSGPGVQAFYQWAARDLAGHGYVAITIDPQGVGYSETFPAGGCSLTGSSGSTAVCPGVPFQQAGNYVDALESGIDYLLSSADPWVKHVDPSHIGIAGHSLSARAASWLQGSDTRVDAVVAWDNLASDLAGDAGSPSGGGLAGSLIGGELPGESEPVTPRVPALGEASDSIGASEPTNTDPDQKKTAYEDWRSRGVPAMELVFKGATHDDWGQSATTSAKVAEEIERFEYYTRAWFDRWLLGDTSATSRLLARSVDGMPLEEELSTKFHSAAFLDGHDCPNLAEGCS
jgi:PA domain-containing protein/peptidase M28-like protein